jgi:hypothetical protein
MSEQRRRVGAYPRAIAWIAYNDDTAWLDDDNGSPSVTLCLVADLFERTTEQATADLRAELARKANHEADAERAQKRLEQTRAFVRAELARIEARETARREAQS